MSSHGALAVAGCNTDNNHGGKKRRRWSTAHQEAVLAPNRFGVKKQLRILGRHHPSSNSVNSLASFQSKSNPIFEPSEPSYGSNSAAERLSEGLRQAEEWKFQSQCYNPCSNGATFVTTADDLGRGGSRTEQHQSTPKVKSRLGKVSPESSLLSTHSGGEWGEEEEDNAVENPIRLLLCNSPAITGKRAGYGLQEESREIISCDYAEGEWRVEEEASPSEGDSRVLAVSQVLTNSDGAQSIDGPRYHLDDGSLQGEEELSTLEACERRSRELVEKVQANAAAELANLRAYKAMIEKLRVDCTKHEAAAKEYAELHRDAVAQLVTAKSENTEVERQRGLQAIAIEEIKQKQGVEKDLQDAMVVSDKLKLETLEKEQDGWRKKVEALEMELMAAKSELSAVAMREERRETEAKAEHRVTTQDNEERKTELEGESQGGAADCGGETEDGSNKTISVSAEGRALSAQRLCEVEAQLAEVFEQMEKLQGERNELEIAVQNGEKRVAEAEKERDTVVLAVQQEWDAVKVALRQEKDKLELELELVREHNTKLQNDLDTKNNILEEGKHSVRGSSEGGSGQSLQVFIGDKVVESGSERGDSLIALWNEYQKLEVELSEAFDHNKKQRSDREALNVALSGVTEGNKKLEGEREALNAALIGARGGNTKLEGELSELHTEKTKLERERDALMTAVQEERQKLENERAVVYKAMTGENEKLESEREVLIAMQEYLKKLEMKQDLAQTVVGGDEKRRRKGKRGATHN